MKYGLVFVATLLLHFQILAQVTLRARVTDASSGEPLPGATVTFSSTSGRDRNSVTDEDGWFNINANGSGKLSVRFVGFDPLILDVASASDVPDALQLTPSTTLTESVVVTALRATEKMPVTFSKMDRIEIQKQNFGQDMPFVLNFTPSVVTTSDAGTGIGYTGIRIRGSDATRINVTINGIPYNDSESQGVFWVNIPDIASSTQDVQVQRGVGTSANGVGAFGASINLQTNTLRDKPYAEWIQSGGSFGTYRTTLGAGTGLIGGKFSFDGRVSSVQSDGFIDRSFSNLKSYYSSAGYYGKKTIIKAIAFGGKERTYQSWYGVPESRLNSDEVAMEETAATEGWTDEQLQHMKNSSPRTFNFYTYPNQVDDYGQDHQQLHLSTQITADLTGHISLHRTHGSGYYEEFKGKDELSNYGLEPVVVNGETITTLDVVRRRWLDNIFYGATWSLQLERDKWNSVLGGTINRYDGDHFGEIIRADLITLVQLNRLYYFNNGLKDDVSVYWRNQFQTGKGFSLFADIQYRGIGYSSSGTENELNAFNFEKNYRFFNPKAGFTWQYAPSAQLYLSLAVAQREPVRSDLVDNPTGTVPSPEKLYDYEIGLRKKSSRWNMNLNGYYMFYRDQLVLTGALNDVGANIRTNAPVSYRAGIELDGGVRIHPKLRWIGNITLSRNRIREFEEILYDYGDAFDQYNEVKVIHRDTHISFSPDVIAGSQLLFRPVQDVELAFLSKYVGNQYLDNTSNEQRKIDPYFLQDIRVSWTLRPKKLSELSFSFLAANIFNAMYSSNGYTYGFLGGATTYRQNYFYPQAGRNFLVMMTVRI